MQRGRLRSTAAAPRGQCHPRRGASGVLNEWAYGPFFVWASRTPVVAMTQGKSKARLQALLEPAVEALGYELSDFELVFGGRRGVLRLYIDHQDAAERAVDDGIRVEDCEAVSRRVSEVLDVEDPIGRDYDLEVSSPGLDRKLVKPAHFDRFAGQAVEGRLRQARAGRRRFTGTLVGRSGETVTINVDGTEWTVGLAELEVIRLVPEY